VAAGVLSALFVSVIFCRHGSMWIAVFLGNFLSIVLVQFLSTAVTLIGQTIAEHAYSRVRWAVLVAVLVLAAMAAGPAISTGFERGLMPAVESIRSSTVGFWLLLPFEPFGRTFVAQHVFPDLVGWATLAAAVDLALLGLVMRLDVNYLEAAVAVSQKLYQQRQQAQRGGTAWVKPTGAGWRVPSLPWCGGVGPIARKQLTTAMRSARGFLIFFLVMGVILAGTLFSLKEGTGQGVLVALGSQVFMLTIIFARALPFDFRGDMDHIESLKVLPLGSTAIAVGQLTAPVLIMTTIHCVLLAIVAASQLVPPIVLLQIAVFTLPFNFLLFAVENLFFLLFPIRMKAATPADLQHVGRTMVEMFVKIIVLGVVCCTAGGFGWAAYWLSGGSQVAAVAAAWPILATAAVVLLPCVSWAYRRFDVSVDTPA